MCFLFFFVFFFKPTTLSALGLYVCSAAGEDAAADTWCRLSGLRLQKSHTMSGSFMWVWGLRFCVWTKDGNYTVYRNHVWHVWHVIWLIMEQTLRFLLLTHTPRGHPWWRKWGCCCQSGPSCPLQCKTWPQSLVDLARCLLTPIHQLKGDTFVSWICSKYSNDSALMHTSSVTHLRWRSGQRWVSSSPHVQTPWLCNSEWCHESPQSSQTLLHYARNNIIVCFTCNVHLKTFKIFLVTLVKFYTNVFC